MATRPPPRKTLARNLKLLMDASGMKAPEVAKRSGVDAKTVNNMLHGRFDPRPEKADQVAQVFGLNGWQLLIPDLPADMFKNGKLEQLIANYVSASPDGRDSIIRVAEMAAKYERD
jgi:transcriptional regulator with XRE-family HTH domain